LRDTIEKGKDEINKCERKDRKNNTKHEVKVGKRYN
jgi:hypothetical protein